MHRNSVSIIEHEKEIKSQRALCAASCIIFDRVGPTGCLSKVSVGWKEICAVVEHSFRNGIQMSSLCFTISLALTDLLCLYKLIYLKFIIKKLLDFQISKRDFWKTFNFATVSKFHP
jgi:hypothetical protein